MIRRGEVGQPEFYDATGALTTANTSSVGNPYLFTGRRWDEELGYYYYRNRYMDPALGRFISRDPIGLWGDAANLGNGYTYAASNPWSLVDPFGLAAGGNQSWGAWLDGIQLALGAAGLTPAVGIVPDAASLVISSLRLDGMGVIIDTGSMIPVAGQFVRGSEFAAKAGKQILKHSDEVADVVKSGDDLVDGAKASVRADGTVSTGLTHEVGDILQDGRVAGTGPGTPRYGQGPDVKPPDEMAVTSRAARRQAMRDAGTPTSRPALSQAGSNGQRQYVTEGANGQPRVQTQHPADKNHALPHWHDAAPKTDPGNGEMLTNRYGQVKYKKEGSAAEQYNVQ